MTFEAQSSPPCWQSHVAPSSNFIHENSRGWISLLQVLTVSVLTLLISLYSRFCDFYWIFKIFFVFQQNSVYVRLHFLLSLYETLLIIDQRLLRLLNFPDDEFCFRRAHCSRPSHWLMTILIVLMTSSISVAQSGSELSSDHLWPLTCFYVHIINSALKITPYLTPPLRHSDITSDITREFFFLRVRLCGLFLLLWQ